MEFISKGPEDAAEMSEYLYPIWHEVFDPLMPWEEAEYVFRAWTTPEAIVRAMSEGYEFGYILEEGERIGLYSYRIQDDGRFYINKLYLESRHRGKGLGSRAIGMMLDTARSAGCHEVYLNVYYRNDRAIEAYKRAGMTGYRHKESIGNGYYRDDYIMSMRIRSRNGLPVASYLVLLIADVEADDLVAGEHDRFLMEYAAHVPGDLVNCLAGRSDQGDQQAVLIHPGAVVVEVPSFDDLHGERGLVTLAYLLQDHLVVLRLVHLLAAVPVAEPHVDPGLQHFAASCFRNRCRWCDRIRRTSKG